jgi:hypothetical protein
MSSVTMDIGAAFEKRLEFAPLSSGMRELMAAEAERWRQTAEDEDAKKASANRRGFLALFGRH